MWCCPGPPLRDRPFLLHAGTVPTCRPPAVAGGEIATARPKPGGATGDRLAAEAEATDDLPVALDVVVADVVEQPSATADQLEEATAGVMVALVHLEVLGQVDDALAQDGDLHFG